MAKGHLRRSVAPWWWPVGRKERVWTVRPSTGPHSLERSIPLAVFIRDIVKYAGTLREARKVISSGYVKVDGVVRKDYKFPVGLMDVVEITPAKEWYRVVPHSSKFLWPRPIPESEAHLKLLRVEGKTVVSGGRVQLHFHDGRNILVDQEEGRRYRTFDSVLVTVPVMRVVNHVPFKAGSYAVIFDGGNVGVMGKIVEIVMVQRRRYWGVSLRTEDGRVVRTIADYVMPVGVEAPLVTVTA